MKKFFIVISSILMGISIYANNPDGIDEKLIRSFEASFPHATKITWHELHDSYVVGFFNEGIRNKITYTKDGTLAEIIRYYKEDQLPVYVQLKVKDNFPRKQIYGVTEVSSVTTPGNFLVSHFVKLEDDKHWTTVRVYNDGTLRLVEKYRKAK